jgi:hypothetical protein
MYVARLIDSKRILTRCKTTEAAKKWALHRMKGMSPVPAFEILTEEQHQLEQREQIASGTNPVRVR